MNRSFLTYSTFMLVFVCQFSFGMKRERESGNQVALANKKSTQQKNFTEFVNQSFDYCVSPVKVEVLKKESTDFALLGSNKKVEQLKGMIQSSNKYNCIDQIQKKRYNNFCKLPEKNVRKLFAYELKKIFDQLYKNEDDAINSLILSYGVDTESQQWQSKMQELRERIDFNFLSMQQPRNDTTWDCELPENVAIAFITAMEENGFDPAAFDVKRLDPEYPDSINAAVSHPKPILVAINKTISIEECKADPTINLFEYENGVPCLLYFNKRLAHKTAPDLKRIAFHEITHMLEAHGEIRRSLIDIIAHVRKVSRKEIMQSYELAEVLLAQETIADALLSVKDPNLARLSLTPQGLYPNSYGILKTINTYLDVLDYFDQEKSSSIITSKDNC